MNNTQFFYRNGIHCLLAQNPINDDWMGFIGLRADHPSHGSIFKPCKNVCIHKYNIGDGMINKVFSSLWWMGFCDNPYSKEKTLDTLKEVADEIGTPSEDDGISDIIDGLFI